MTVKANIADGENTRFSPVLTDIRLVKNIFATGNATHDPYTLDWFSVADESNRTTHSLTDCALDNEFGGAFAYSGSFTWTMSTYGLTDNVSLVLRLREQSWRSMNVIINGASKLATIQSVDRSGAGYYDLVIPIPSRRLNGRNTVDLSVEAGAIDENNWSLNVFEARLVKDYEQGTLTLPEGYTPVFTTEAMTSLPQGVKAYIPVFKDVISEDDPVGTTYSNTLVLQQVYADGSEIIPAATPLLLKAEKAGDYTYEVSTGTDGAYVIGKYDDPVYAANNLIAQGDTGTIAAMTAWYSEDDIVEDGHYFYLLDAEKKAFVQTTATTTMNQPYFYVDKRNQHLAEGADKLPIEGLDDGTGIQNVTKRPLATDNTVYDLLGRKVTGAMQKGVYIVNGKKIVNK